MCEKNGQSTPEFCNEDKTNGGFLDYAGIHEIICWTGVPFPFIEFRYVDGTFYSISALHKVQELLALCTRCEPNNPRAKDLGGFLFHLKFDERNIWAKPQRECLGRYVVDYCRDKTCQKARCHECEQRGQCEHHGSLEDFKDYKENERTMKPLHMRHTSFLDGADLHQRQIRVIYLPFAAPQQQQQQQQPILVLGQPAAVTSPSVMSESAQTPATDADLTPFSIIPESTMVPQQSAYLTPPPSVELSPELDVLELLEDAFLFESPTMQPTIFPTMISDPTPWKRGYVRVDLRHGDEHTSTTKLGGSPWAFAPGQQWNWD